MQKHQNVVLHKNNSRQAPRDGLSCTTAPLEGHLSRADVCRGSCFTWGSSSGRSKRSAAPVPLRGSRCSPPTASARSRGNIRSPSMTLSRAWSRPEMTSVAIYFLCEWNILDLAKCMQINHAAWSQPCPLSGASVRANGFFFSKPTPTKLTFAENVSAQNPNMRDCCGVD